MSNLPIHPEPELKPDTTPKQAVSGASVGGKGTANAEPSIMSEPEVQANGISNTANSGPRSSETGIQTLEQALATMFPGLMWLQEHKLLITFNDRNTRTCWLGLHGIKATANGLILWSQPTQAVLAEGEK